MVVSELVLVDDGTILVCVESPVVDISGSVVIGVIPSEVYSSAVVIEVPNVVEGVFVSGLTSLDVL